MDKRDQLIVGVSLAGLAAVLLWANRLLPGGHMQPRYDNANALGIDVGGMVAAPYGGKGSEHHYIAPSQYTGPTVLLPVRYPVRGGHEITCLIEGGFAPLYKARPQDMDWLDNPPSEANL